MDELTASTTHQVSVESSSLSYNLSMCVFPQLSFNIYWIFHGLISTVLRIKRYRLRHLLYLKYIYWILRMFWKNNIEKVPVSIFPLYSNNLLWKLLCCLWRFLYISLDFFQQYRCLVTNVVFLQITGGMKTRYGIIAATEECYCNWMLPRSIFNLSQLIVRRHGANMLITEESSFFFNHI